MTYEHIVEYILNETERLLTEDSQRADPARDLPDE
jgi:hypothetical protein